MGRSEGFISWWIRYWDGVDCGDIGQSSSTAEQSRAERRIWLGELVIGQVAHRSQQADYCVLMRRRLVIRAKPSTPPTSFPS